MASPDDNSQTTPSSGDAEARQAKKDLWRQIREQAEAQGKVKPVAPQPRQAPPPPKRRFKLRAQPAPAEPIAPAADDHLVEDQAWESAPTEAPGAAAQEVPVMDQPPAASEPASDEPAKSAPAKGGKPSKPEASMPASSPSAPDAAKRSSDASADSRAPAETARAGDESKDSEAKAENGEDPKAQPDAESVADERREKLRKLWELIGGRSLTLSLGIHAVILIAAVFIVFNYSRTERIDFLPGGGTKQGQEASDAMQNRVERKRNPFLRNKSQLTRVAVEKSMSEISLPDAQPELISLPNPDSFMKPGGGFGPGSGLGGKSGAVFTPIMMFGKQINARRLAVVLDVSSSMTPYLQAVVNEVDRVARGSPVILNWGCGLERKLPGTKVDEVVRRTQSKQFEEFWRNWQQVDPRNIGKPGLPVPKTDLFNFFAHRNNTFYIEYNGVAFAWVALLCEELRNADAIYWFSDFEDKVEERQMQTVLENLKLRKQRLYIHPQIHGQFFDPVVINLVWPSGGQVIEPDDKKKEPEKKS